MVLRDVLSKRVGPHTRLLSAAAYIGGLTFITIFPRFDRKTEIEEHGLIPGYATHGFEREWVDRLRRNTEKARSAPGALAYLADVLPAAGIIAHAMNVTALNGRDR